MHASVVLAPSRHAEGMVMSARYAARLLSLLTAFSIAAGAAHAQIPALKLAPEPAPALPAPAPSADLEQRVRELESLVRSLQAQVATQPTNFSTQNPPPQQLPPASIDGAPVESETTTAAAPEGKDGAKDGGG